MVLPIGVHVHLASRASGGQPGHLHWAWGQPGCALVLAQPARRALAGAPSHQHCAALTSGSPHLLCRFMARSDFAFMFHAFALIFYVRTWMWHTTPAAAGLPGAQGFGWFFR